MKKYLEALVLFLFLGIKHTRCKQFFSNRQRRGNNVRLMKERQASSIKGWWWESRATIAAAAEEEEEELQPQFHKSNMFPYSNKQSRNSNEGGGVSSSTSVTEGTNGRILRPTGAEQYFLQTQQHGTITNNNDHGSSRQRRKLGRYERDLQDIQEATNNDNKNNNQQWTTTNSSDASARQKQCAVNANGSFGSSAGIRVSIFFFYQVEAAAGTTETQMNTVVLQDIETALSDILLSRVLDECRGSSSTSSTLAEIETETAAREDQEAPSSSSGGRYVGLSSRPADFVLRGFECSQEATQPCFIVSGSMTVYVVDLDAGAVQEQMRFEILLIMSSGAIPATVSTVSSVLLLDDSLNLATLPIVEMEPPTLQPTTLLPIVSPTTPPTLLPTRTEEPTVQMTTVAPTPPPTTEVPSASPTTAKPTLPPTVTPSISTDYPTFAPSMSPTMASPTTIEPPSPVPPVPTTDSDNQTETTTVEPATTTDSPTQAVGNETVSIIDPTNDPQISPLPNATATTQKPATSQPNIATAEPIYYAFPPYHESAIQRFPVWGWVLLGLAIFICCTYSDPDDDDDDPGVNQNLRAAQERNNLITADEIDKEKDNHNDSEVFSSGEYFRKLYRQ